MEWIDAKIEIEIKQDIMRAILVLNRKPTTWARACARARQIKSSSSYITRE